MPMCVCVRVCVCVCVRARARILQGDAGSFRNNTARILEVWSSKGLADTSLGVARDTLISEVRTRNLI